MAGRTTLPARGKVPGQVGILAHQVAPYADSLPHRLHHYQNYRLAKTAHAFGPSCQRELAPLKVMAL